MKLTETERQKLLDQAVTAVTAWLADTTPRVPAGPYSHSQDTRQAPESWRLHAAAITAVTAAVTRGDHIHTLITARVRRCTGLTIVDLIDDPDARAHALVRERHAAALYADTVRHAIRTGAVRAVLTDGTTKTAAATMYDITRATLDKWLAEHEAGTAPQTPWERTPDRDGD